MTAEIVAGGVYDELPPDRRGRRPVRPAWLDSVLAAEGRWVAVKTVNHPSIVSRARSAAAVKAARVEIAQRTVNGAVWMFARVRPEKETP